MIADSVGYLAGQGKRVIYDAEHFFDAFRDGPTTRSAVSALQPGRGRERDALRHERLLAAVAGERGHGARGRGARRLRSGGHPYARRRRLRGCEHAGGGGGRARASCRAR